MAIVTGSGSGIGRATAKLLASYGAKVVVADINPTTAKETVDDIRANGGAAVDVEVDVADDACARKMIDAAISSYGGLHILHNNAAAMGDVIANDGTVADMDAAVWDRTLAVDVTGPMLAIKYAVPHMIEGGGGSIINTSSAAALVGDNRGSAYGVAKAGLNALTIYVATQYGKQGIRCNAVSPGLVLSDHVRSVRRPEDLAVAEETHLTTRLGRPEDIANVVAFLASDESAFVTGHILRAEGGYLVHTPWLGRYPKPD